MMLYAHTPNDNGDWHRLDDHLRAVAELAGTFAAEFGYKDLAQLIGLWHDLGKVNPAFQQYLLEADQAKRENRLPPHSAAPHAIWGAAFAHALLRQQKIQRWPEVVLPILGHHSRLVEPSATAAQRIAEFREQQPHALELAANFESALRNSLSTNSPSTRMLPISRNNQEMLIRMLFSSLIDADRLNTEQHLDAKRSKLRAAPRPTFTELDSALTRHIARLSTENDVLKQVRREVYDACIASAKTEPGVFRLTVPTGGGKTLSSLAFALRHASHNRNDLRRIVVALPYTSIIEQNARVYRDIPGFGSEAVLEHHSMVEPVELKNEAPTDSILRSQLGTENWEAPIIVTTTVQLFESLFSNRPSKVRKLHNLTRSVIILDEIQTFPPDFLLPTLDVLRQLATPVSEGGFGCSVVLCTATQPAFNSGPLTQLLPQSEQREIVPAYKDHFERLRRVTYEWDSTPHGWGMVAEMVRTQKQALVILNTRVDAIRLLDAFEDSPPWRFHLSTLLCPAHRRKVLDEVQSRLNSKESVQLIATQVVECGVDLDFPIVYRAIGPLDRVVQAAGRCNRNFTMQEGRVVIFDPAEGASPRGPYEIGLGLSSLIMSDRDANQLHDPRLYEEYFQRLYQEVDPDKRNIQHFREQLNFPEISDRYRLIGPTVPVVVQYGNTWRKHLAAWLERPSRKTWQALQPFTVNLYEWELRSHETDCEKVNENLYLWIGKYDSATHRGIQPLLTDPSDLIV